MKISLAWVFDHIKADVKDIDIDQLVDVFNKTTAEIEYFEQFSVDLDLFSLVKVASVDKNKKVTVHCSELKKEFELPARKDAFVDQCYMIKKNGKSYDWAALEDFNCPKEGFVPALYCQNNQLSGAWKKDFESQDYILDIDNKSITHRPDMWGHRGFAREIAAILGLPLLPLSQFFSEKEVESYDHHAPHTKSNPFDIKIKHTKIIKRFAGLYIPEVANKPSSLHMASRLMRIGSRPIDFIVDATNYVMLDTSQPMHTFDADLIPSRKIVVTMAGKKEKLLLLDDDEIELSSDDIVITDGKDPISLAGIMGGKSTGISDQTSALFLESANFDSATIRRSAFRLKKRTDASARFEKTLDPNQNVSAIFRFLKLLDNEGIAYSASDHVVSLGKPLVEAIITLKHDFIERRMGVSVDPDFVSKTFQSLEFGVKVSKSKAGIGYTVTVPTFRCAKDVQVKEDLVEEVGRFFGYDKVPHQLPQQLPNPFDIRSILTYRRIKHYLAYGIHMRQVRNYPFYDEAFLKTFDWEIKHFVAIQNPVSENLYRMVTSLVPHLIKNVEKNQSKYHQLRFFESGRIWKNGKQIKETKTIAGIFFDAKSDIDFYESKALLTPLFDMLHLSVTWEKMTPKESAENPWFYRYETAKLMAGKTSIGYAGKLDPAYLSKVSAGSAFAFELDLDFLRSYDQKVVSFKPVPKYPSVERDISILVPLKVTVDQVKKIIASSSKQIIAVDLVDFFQKDEWHDQKSLTLRFVLQDPKKTLEKDEVDAVYNHIVKALDKIEARVR